MTTKEESFGREENRQLQQEIRQLKRQLRKKLIKLRTLQPDIQEYLLLIDLQQSFIVNR